MNQFFISPTELSKCGRTQYERPQRTQVVAGSPDTKHKVPSGRGGWSNGLHKVFPATLVAVLASS